MAADALDRLSFHAPPRHARPLLLGQHLHAIIEILPFQRQPDFSKRGSQNSRRSVDVPTM
jgi:hypothetical protein